VTLYNTNIKRTWSHTCASRVGVVDKQLLDNAKQIRGIIEIPNELATPCIFSTWQKYG